MGLSKQEYRALFGTADPDAAYEYYRDLCRERRLDELEYLDELADPRRNY